MGRPILWAHWHQRLLHFLGQILPMISKIGVCLCPRVANESRTEKGQGVEVKSQRGCYFSVSYHVFLGCSRTSNVYLLNGLHSPLPMSII